ncbi:Serine/threonine protein kinase [Actinacidiphila yanglinensis]|uniref:non-specific serine/threonine protein kinase n=2 Tax=Actinacidiphila yanglinensis TaxID=310779 RepID=A0A1H6AJJ4_9ACTN|nr:Serine/threonine protein kinase [Actinacidiphila yanglinensis]
MGRVYLGLADGRFAAVKRVHPHLTEDEGFLRRFGHELDHLARLPAGVSAELLDSDRNARPPWLATAYVPGITLDAALQVNGGPLPVPDVWLLLRDAAAGLAAVNGTGIVHRDLKPSNVMLRPDGLTLIDFGVAMALEQSRLTQSGMVIGTPAYMSPEQASSRRNLTGATDVFALGCLLGYAATGQPPYGDGGGVQMLYRIIHEQPDLEPLRAVDRELAAVVADCLAYDPQDRPTAAELVRRATPHVAADVPPWPPRVREPLAMRTESARRMPEPRSEDAPADISRAPLPAAGPERHRWRLPRVLVIPLVVVATGGAAVLVPYVLTPKTHTPSSAASGGTRTPAGATTRSSHPSATPSSAKPSTTAHSSPPHGAGKQGSRSTAGAGTATSGASGSSGSADGGSSTNAGGSGGSKGSGAGGSSSGGSSGGTGSSGSGSAISASGTHRLLSALDGNCLASNVNHSTSAYLASCSSNSIFQWTYFSISDGTFELRNGSTGNCLAGSGDNFTYMTTCGSTDADRWKFGSPKSARSTLENTSAGQCLQNSTAVGGYAVTRACTASSDMMWSND